MKAPKRVAVTGAAGQIAYSLLFRIANGDMLGKDQPVILQLLDITPAMAAVKGVVMELEDCAFPLLAGIVVTDDPNVAFKDADYALLVGPDLPAKTFTAMLRLDHNRALSQLAAKTGRPVDSIEKLVVWGNHSPTMYPDIRFASSNGDAMPKLVNDEAWVKDTFIPTVGKRGAAIIEARGLSSAASAANAAIDHMRDWALGTNGKWVTMGVPSQGDYEIPEGVIYGMPVTCQNGEYTIVKGLDIDAFSRERMNATLEELEGERNGVKHLLG